MESKHYNWRCGRTDESFVPYSSSIIITTDQYGHNYQMIITGMYCTNTPVSE